MFDNGAEVVNLSAPQQWHTTLDLTASPMTFRNGGSPLATTTVVVAELLGQERTTFCSCSSSFASGTEVLRVGVESFLRGNLQVKFGGRRASTQPYEYSDYNSSDEQSLTFDSYTIPEDDLELGQSRLLEVDNRVVVPAKTHLRMIVTPADVPHSWAVPSSGVKCDAVPGRSNQTSISVQREGVYYGQCSEIRGTNHAFMRAPGYIGRLLSPLWLSRTTPPGVGGHRCLTPIYRRRSCSFERLWFSGIQSIPPPNRVSWSGKKIVGSRGCWFFRKLLYLVQESYWFKLYLGEVLFFNATSALPSISFLFLHLHVGDAAEQKDAQVGGNEASRMDVDLKSPPDNAANKVPDDRLYRKIGKNQTSVEAAPEKVPVEDEASFQAEPQN
ncbi:hypothetical protein IEQ34_023610 [Dendrobium chrysotoxum]|uniref:Cytochrome c oxidase polypeptide II n=2 Tax=Mesangiospermae TaxID=1437183 RepID=A0AAV7FJQ4_DENCH|nr:hypothetical protein IEQ34_023610 [Dendrobium chrysotoxum]